MLFRSTVFPNVSMEMVLKQKEGKDFLQVLCTATGGRPHPDITWVLPSSAHMPLSQKHNLGIESVASSHWFPSDLYEGEHVTCIFGYPLLPALHTRSVTLPTYREYQHGNPGGLDRKAVHFTHKHNHTYLHRVCSYYFVFFRYHLP